MIEHYDNKLEDDDESHGFSLAVITNPAASTVGQSACVEVVMRQVAPSLRITKRRLPGKEPFFIVEAFGDYSDMPHSRAPATWHNLSGDIPLAAFANQFAEDKNNVEKQLSKQSIRIQPPTTTMNCIECRERIELDRPFVDPSDTISCGNCSHTASATSFIRAEYF